MSDNSAIEWCDATWNPVIGCDKVSDGCDGCYAITNANIRAANPNPKIADAYAGVVHRVDGKLDWTGQINMLDARLSIPLRWRRPRRIFVNAQSDLFHKAVTDDFIARAFAVMAACPQHTFQILTKRHGRMRSLLSTYGWWTRVVMHALDLTDRPLMTEVPHPWQGGALANVHLGVSVEDQAAADLRIPALRATPAAVRWISAEPLLGPVTLARPDGIVNRGFRGGPCGSAAGTCDDNTCRTGLDWIVAGGESGRNARPMHPDWARALRDECAAARVPFLLKQWGEWMPVLPDVWQNRRETDWLVRRGDGYHWPLAEPHGAADGTEATVRRVGKKAAGDLLDGRTHDEYPTAPTALWSTHA